VCLFVFASYAFEWLFFIEENFMEGRWDQNRRSTSDLVNAWYILTSIFRVWIPVSFLARFMLGSSDEGANQMSFGGGGGDVSENRCSALLKEHLNPVFEMPNECYRFSRIRAGIIRRDSNKDDHNIAFAGMDPGSAIKAMSAREQGHPHEAQITRRLTSRSKATDSSWFE
jgi:hypothetical protein